MGFYLEPPNAVKGKVQALVKDYHAQRLARAPQRVPVVADKVVLVCVVDNRVFEAAGICYCDSELEAFNQPRDPRPKTWLLVPIEDTIRLAPHLEPWLRGEKPWNDYSPRSNDYD